MSRSCPSRAKNVIESFGVVHLLFFGLNLVGGQWHRLGTFLLDERGVILGGSQTLEAPLLGGELGRTQLLASGVVGVFAEEIETLHGFWGGELAWLVEELVVCVLGAEGGPLLQTLDLLVDLEHRFLAILQKCYERVGLSADEHIVDVGLDL
jgi:hypothetical protein